MGKEWAEEMAKDVQKKWSKGMAKRHGVASRARGCNYKTALMQLHAVLQEWGKAASLFWPDPDRHGYGLHQDM
jgi:hypothetical protein